MVYDALKKQELKTRLRSKYVFVNPDNKPIEIETLCQTLNLYLLDWQYSRSDNHVFIGKTNTSVVVILKIGEQELTVSVIRKNP